MKASLVSWTRYKEGRSCLKGLPPFVCVARLNESRTWGVTSVGNNGVPGTNLPGGLLNRKYIYDIGNMDNDLRIKVVFFDNVFGLFECLLCATEDVNDGGASLGKSIGDFSSDILASTCDGDVLAGLG
jgi:hypothetical protein